MPGPKQHINDHHKHRETCADEASSKLDDVIWNVSQIVNSLEETGNTATAAEWEGVGADLMKAIDKVRRLAR